METFAVLSVLAMSALGDVPPALQTDPPVWEWVTASSTEERDRVRRSLEAHVASPEGWRRLEQAVRRGPARHAPAPTGRMEQLIACTAYANFEAPCLFYIPTTYRPDRPAPVLVVFMGGSWSMPERNGNGRSGWRDVTEMYFTTWVETAEREGWILVAPMAKHGWGNLGLALTKCSLEWVTARYAVDPDRIFGWGQSMGGHASWRAGLHVSDWYGAVAPVCGGYDYGDRLAVLKNVPMYQVWGARDPHPAKLADINQKNAEALQRLGYDVVSVKYEQGGHELFEGEYPEILKFFTAHPRTLYPKTIIAETNAPAITKSDQGYAWSNEFTWRDPLPTGRFYWTELVAQHRADQPARWIAEWTGPNRLDVKTENVKTLRLYFHPRLVDFSQPLHVTVNGREAPGWSRVPAPSLDTLLQDLDRFRDGGRIFTAQGDLHIEEAGASPLWTLKSLPPSGNPVRSIISRTAVPARRLGVQFGEGMVVAAVAEDSLAAHLGLQAGDTLVSVGSRPVRNLKDVQYLLRTIPARTPFTVEILRDRASLTFTGQFEE